MDSNKYRKTVYPVNSTLTVVQDNEYRWGAIDSDGNVVIPFGKYAWIDGFQNGLAKVIGHKDKTSPQLIGTFDNDWNYIPYTDKNRHAEQGIINEAGKEVLPLKYYVWKFYGKDFDTIKYFDRYQGGEEHTVSFESLNPDLADSRKDTYEIWASRDDYNEPDYDMRDTWDAMTDGMYGDMPDGFDGDFDFMGR